MLCLMYGTISCDIVEPDTDVVTSTAGLVNSANEEI